jgi:hypothetical protein
MKGVYCMKTWKHCAFVIIVVIIVFCFGFTACKDGDETPELPKTIEVTFFVPNTNLKGQTVTIIFPSNFDENRRDTIKAKFVDTMNRLNMAAGDPGEFKTKINAILDRGLKITIEETSEFSYFIKVVDNNLVAETAYIENTSASGAMIAGSIITLIDNGDFVAKAFQRVTSSVNHFSLLCCTYEIFSIQTAIHGGLYS